LTFIGGSSGTRPFSWLERAHFLALERHGPYPPRIILRDPSGDGTEYTKPKMPYVTLPIGFWEQQWITALSGTATAFLLVLLELCGGRDRGPAQQVTRERRDLYTISDDSWTRATEELSDFGLLVVERESSGRDLEYTRVRNAYRLNRGRLDEEVPMEVFKRRAQQGASTRIERRATRGNPCSTGPRVDIDGGHHAG